jgi:hypothetical protein
VAVKGRKMHPAAIVGLVILGLFVFLPFIPIINIKNIQEV